MVPSPPSRDARLILQAEGLSKAFGGVQAVNRCSLGMAEGSISGLIGPNGSGKTTLFNILTGMVTPDAGVAVYRGERISGLRPHEIVRKGITRTFQITRLFAKMTVWENLRVAARRGQGVIEEGRAEDLLKSVDLWPLKDEYAENLSYGQQKLLEFARALIPGPAMLLLDEPFAGVNRVMAAKLVSLIRKLQAEGRTFFLIDHEMKLVMDLCDWVFVMDSGELMAQGPPAQIRQDPRVLEAYFGR